MKKYIFTIALHGAKELGVDQIPIIAKNMQSALAKLCQGDFYTEDQVINVSIFKKE
jgi:hypothetical protein